MQATQATAKAKVLENLPSLPLFIQEYFQKKIEEDYSSVTLFEYQKEIKRFLEWLIRESYSKATVIKDVEIADLEKMSEKDLSMYKRELQNRKKNLAADKRKMYEESGDELPGLSKSTIKRSLTSLRSLFNFLATTTNEETNLPYLSSNQMQGVKNVNDSVKMSVRTKKMEPMIFFDNEGLDFLDFIENRYEKLLASRQAVAFFEKNKIRDLAIIGLFLGTGIRLSELVNINLRDLELSDESLSIRVIRKGGQMDWVTVASPMVSYITDYLAIRKTTYQVTENVQPLFLSTYGGAAKRLKANAIEKMLDKYSSAYNKRTTPHKLRHSVGTQIYRKTGSIVTTAQLLGQNNTNSTSIYTHIGAKEQVNIMNHLYD
ncbi:MAG TPA: tyrosine recombinase XerS [Enterococcus columbae]|nr:tyrosine recombinase XerS [Enterococcus columbae]